ncbi:MAG: hypothetical protein EB150_01860 [Nitrososphaeria archaeon]|nr:hypothetical protein [Nitrososphaeria archaeon]NDB50756.1 hypothetical protein [Nitrosopumilaceae archaeon]NDB88271.1 hypothetical protein [Nitrososphaerota archaeon]NDB47275.1 hypothetical protein [Nitrososphaeria archaeon]NDB63069.1 hypothetical protein [Nitrosopumilaceae archaeon]
MDKVWLGGIYLKEEGGYELVLRSLQYYKKRLRNIRNSPEIKDTPMFAQIIEQEAMKAYKTVSLIITKINEGLQNSESLKDLEPELSTIQKALVCYQTDIKKIDSDKFYSDLVADKDVANADLGKIQSALDKIGSYC